MDLALPETGWTFCLFALGAVTTVSVSMPIGFNIGVINAPASHIKAWGTTTLYRTYGMVLTETGANTLLATVVSIFLIGGVIGSLGGAYVANRYGRKKSYLGCAILETAGAICYQFCRTIPSVELLLAGRFLLGLAAGLTTSVIPMYLAEVSPTKLRGTMGVLCPLGLTAGVVVGQVVSLDQLLGTSDLWHYALSCSVVLNILCYGTYHLFPESPKYLFSVKGDQSGALDAIRTLFGRGSIGDDYIKLQAVTNKQPDRQPASRSLWSVIRDPTLTLPLVLVCSLQGGQQLSGISAVFFYSVSIFESVGLSSTSAKYANLGVGCLNLFVSFFGLILMARYNRRLCSLLSCSSCALMLFALTMSIYCIDIVSWSSYACIASILLYIVFFQFGLGPIPFFIGSELFDVGPRPAAMAIGSLSSWGCNFIIGMLFPILQSSWGAFVFLPFSISCVMLTVLLKFYLPETRGIEVAEVAQKVSRGFQSRVL